MPCRFNKRRLWTHRIQLESKQHAQSVFVTLTFSDDHHPGDGSLRVSHVQLFLKRLRKRTGDGVFRYFAVGEYGDETWRPHYHLVLFGLGTASEGDISDAWKFGFVDVRDLSPELCQYIAGYVVKKLTKPDDPKLMGRTPEFARMSLKPGIGAGFVPRIADALSSRAGSRHIAETGDVPVALRTDGKKLPLGRYLRRRLRDEMGFEQVGQPEVAKALQAEEMRALWEASKTKDALVQEVKAERNQMVLQLKGRMAINESRKIKPL